MLGIGAAEDQCPHPGDMARVGGQQFAMLGIAVVRLVGQPEAGLRKVYQVPAGVLGVGVHVQSDSASDSGSFQGAEDAGQRVGIGGGVDYGQLVEQWRHPAMFDQALVDEAGVEIPDAPLVGVGSCAAVRCVDDQVADVLLGPVVEGAKRAVGRAVGWHLVLGQPAPVDVAEQVVLWADLRIDEAQVDT